jgi:hypothetical protein
VQVAEGFARVVPVVAVGARTVGIDKYARLADELADFFKPTPGVGHDFCHVAAIQTDVDHEAQKILISLPDQVKLDVYVDPASMVIYDETKNIFTPLSLERTNSALLELETEVLEKAKANGIEEAALSNARLLVQSFIAGAVASEGYTIEFAD